MKSFKIVITWALSICKNEKKERFFFYIIWFQLSSHNFNDIFWAVKKPPQNLWLQQLCKFQSGSLNALLPRKSVCTCKGWRTIVCLWVCSWTLLVSFCNWCLGGELTWLDMDPCRSWFGYHQVGLRGRTSAPLLSQLSFPHSEQSASEHLEYQRENRNGFCDEAHTWTHAWLAAVSL